MLKNEKFFLVKVDILPDTIVKTVRAKELINSGKAKTVNNAVAEVGLSRSAFYKYRDGVFPLQGPLNGTIVSISMQLKHQAGVLSGVLNTIAEFNVNILTINQNIPLQGTAHVTVSIEVGQMKLRLDEMISKLNCLDGVLKIELVGQT